MGKNENPHLLGSVLFGFYEYQGSIRVLVNIFNGGF